MTDDESERLLERAAKLMADNMMTALIGSGAFTSPRPTAIRLTSWGAFEVVDIADDGSIIEPPKRCPMCGPILLCSKHMAMIS